MGQALTCAFRKPRDRIDCLLTAILDGEPDLAKSVLDRNPSSVTRFSGHVRHGLSPLHLAASSGQIQILSLLLDYGADPDSLNRRKQTPIMLAAMHGKIACVNRLIEARANVLMFDKIRGRTCLHYAAFYGHLDCLQAILSYAHSSPVASSWGLARFVNIRDGSGASPLHLAAWHKHAECVHVLLDNGALVCASTGGFGRLGKTPLHLAARGGSVECARELLAWGADRHVLDAIGRTPYLVALSYKHVACAALLNPSSAEPLVWPAASKLIRTLDTETKALLKKTLIEANINREKSILNEAAYSHAHPDSPSNVRGVELEESDEELCCICFDQACTIQVEECGHQMCSQCTLAFICQINKANNHRASSVASCPFCRCTISQLVIPQAKKTANDNDASIVDNNDANIVDKNDASIVDNNDANIADKNDASIADNNDEIEMSPSKPKRSRKYWSYSEGSNSFKGLSAMGNLGKMVVRGSGKIVDDSSEEMEAKLATLEKPCCDSAVCG